MTYFITITIILLCIFRKNSKFLFNIVFIWMWILTAFNYVRADYEMYIGLYNMYSTFTKLYDAEILFQIICKLGYLLGLNYKVFFALYNIIPLMLIATSIKKMSKNISIVAACYLIFPFALDAVQMRHFMAMAFITYGMTFIVNSDRNKDIFKYLICNIIAIGFHYSAAFFLLIVIAKKINKKHLKTIVIVMIIIELVVINADKLIDILGYFLPSTKLNAYFIRSRWKIELSATVVVTMFQLLLMPMIYSIRYIYKIHNKHIENNEKQKDLNFINNIIKFDWIMLCLIPAYTYNMELMRIFRGILLVNYIAMSNVFVKQKSKDNLVVLIILLTCVFIYLYFLIIHVNTLDTTIFAILNNNILFSK